MNRVKQLLYHPQLLRRPNPSIALRQARPVTQVKNEPVIIELEPDFQTSRYRKLSELMEIGRHSHQQARGAFVQLVPTGYYIYEQREELRTCALAAAYVGYFGPSAINEYSNRSMIETELEPIIGYHPGQTIITSPVLYDGAGHQFQRTSSVSDLIEALNDHHGWTRAAIGRMLARQGL